MSFPVLQRMDRKRPEMIQPISWQAEAMKGLAQGLQTGVQLASTVNQIKLQQAANARAEALHGVQTQLMQQQTKALKLENQTKANQVNIQNMLTGGIINDNAAQLSLQQQGLVMDYTTGMTRLPAYNQQYSQEYAPKTLREGLQSGYFQGPLLAEHHKASALALSNAPTADKILALDNMYEKTAPFANELYAAETFSGVPMLAGLAQTLSPARYQLFMSDKVDATVKVTASNRAGMDEAIIAAAAQNAGTTADALVASEKPVQVPFAKAIGGLRAGYFEGDFARMTAESSDPDKFIAYLGKMKVPPAIVARVKAQADAMQGKTDVDGAAIGTASSAFVSDSIGQYVPEQSVADKPIVSTVKIGEQEVNVTQPKSFFDKIGEAAVSMVDGIKDRIMDDTPNDILVEIDERAKAVTRNVDNDADRIVARHQFLKRELDQLTSEQRKAAADPAQTNEANKLAVVMERLRGQVMKIEQTYFQKATTGTTTTATTKASAPASASATSGAGTSIPVQGDVVEGYRFKGGDPSKPENWEKVQ